MKRFLCNDKLEFVSENNEMKIKDIKDAFRGLRLIGVTEIAIKMYSAHININVPRFYMYFKNDQETMQTMFMDGLDVEIKENRVVFFYKDKKVNLYDENIEIDRVVFSFKNDGESSGM